MTETHKYAPNTMWTHDGSKGFFEAPVVSVQAHPIGSKPLAVTPGLVPVEFRLAGGSTRHHGCKRAYINSELRMVLVFEDLRDEVIKARWEDVPEELQVKL